MASINSFASTPYPVPSLDEEFDKNCVVFKHPELVSNGKLLFCMLHESYVTVMLCDFFFTHICKCRIAYCK